MKKGKQGKKTQKSKDQRSSFIAKKNIYTAALSEIFNGNGQSSTLHGLAVLHELADKGFTDALLKLGLLYLHGTPFISVDYTKARQYYEKAYALGDYSSCWALSTLYLQGLGVPKDTEKGLNYLNEGIEHKDPQAEYSMASYYLQGKYVKKNFEKAKELAEKSGEHGFYEAYFHLGNWFLRGIECQKDLNLAKQYFEKSIKAENPQTFYYLGLISALSNTESDKEKAKKYLKKARTLGVKEADSILNALENNPDAAFITTLI